MRLLDSSLTAAADHLAADAALLSGVDETGSGETLRFWETREPAVIVGALGVIRREVHEDACRADNVPILRRPSGGGAVVVAEGCLNYSLVLSLDARPELRQVSTSYRLILNRIVYALGLPGLAMQGQSDLAFGDRKVSGNAQRRGRRALLHQGTLLWEFNARLLERYLREPERQPAYRSRRPHCDFVANVPLQPALIRAAIAHAWRAQPEIESADTGFAAC